MMAIATKSLVNHWNEEARVKCAGFRVLAKALKTCAARTSYRRRKRPCWQLPE